MQLQRLDNQVPSQYPDLPEQPSVTARRLYYDTVGHGSPAALLCAWKAFGADHLVAGSDYPVLLPFETYRQTFHYIREVAAGGGRGQDPERERPDRPGPPALRGARAAPVLELVTLEASVAVSSTFARKEPTSTGVSRFVVVLLPT